MGLFSKFNLRAVDQAYKDLAALQFVSITAVQTLDACEYGGTCVDVGAICDNVAHEIVTSLYDNADGEFELGVAIQRFNAVSSSIKRGLVEQFGHGHAGHEIGQELHSMFEFIAPKLLKSAKRGYLHFSTMDAVNLVERYQDDIAQALFHALERGENYLTEIEQAIEEESVSAIDNDHRAPDEHVENLYQTIETEMDESEKLDRFRQKGKKVGDKYHAATTLHEEGLKAESRQLQEAIEERRLVVERKTQQKKRDRDVVRKTWEAAGRRSAAVNGIRNAPSKPKTASKKKKVGADASRCPECSQMLIIDKREAGITCPMCGHQWTRRATRKKTRSG